MFKDPNMLIYRRVTHFMKRHKTVTNKWYFTEIQLLCGLQRSVERIPAEICVA